MLSPHAGVAGPVPKHTPLLVAALQQLGCEVQSEPWGRHANDESLGDQVLGRARDVLALRRSVASSRFDVLVVKTSHDWRALGRDLALVGATRRHVRRIVVQFHGSRVERLVERGSRLFKAASWMLFCLTDAVFVLSEEEARLARSFYPRGRFYVVVNPFEPPTETAVPRPHTSAEGRWTIVFASRVIPEKGIFETIDAFARLRARNQSRLVVAGDGAALPAAVRRADALGLDGDVVFTGRVDPSELAEIYDRADVFVLPTYWPEGFPTAIAEAMSAGLAIVTTRRRGIADHLDDGTNAIFVPPRDPTAVAAAIDRILDDEDLRAAMAVANRAKVLGFRPEHAAARYLRALEEVVGS